MGENEYAEKNKNATISKRLGFSKCRQSLAIPKEAEYNDIFDVLMHSSYECSLITRSQRAKHVKDDNDFLEVFSNLKARDFLRFILERYETDGIKELKRERLSSLIELNNLGTTKEAAKVFGSAQNLIDAFYKLQKNLYAS